MMSQIIGILGGHILMIHIMGRCIS